MGDRPPTSVVANRELFYGGCRPGAKVFMKYTGHKRWEARILVRRATKAVYRRVNKEIPAANGPLFWAVTPDLGEYPEELSTSHDVAGLIWTADGELNRGCGIGDLTGLDDVYDFRAVLDPAQFMEIVERCDAAERREVMRELRHLQEPGLTALEPIEPCAADMLGVMTGQGSMPRAYAEWKVIGSTDSSAVGTRFMQDVDYFCVVQGGAIALQGQLCYLLVDSAKQDATVHTDARDEEELRFGEPPRSRSGELPKDSDASSHDSLFSGTVKAYYEHKGFAFVAPDGGSRQVFAHVRDNRGLRGCRVGDAVKYDLEWDPCKGKYKAVGLFVKDGSRK